MPVIPFQRGPEVEPEHAPGVFRREQATPGAFGAYSAAGRERLGAAGERMGDVLAANAIRFQRQQNETDVDAANTAFEAKKRSVLFDPGGFYDKKGKDAYDSMTPTATSIEDLRKEVRGSLANREQQRMFDVMSRRSTEMDLRSMSRHAAAENQTYRVGVAEAAIGNAQADSAAYWNDPYRFALSVGNIKIHAENRARLLGRTDPEQIQADVGHYVGQAWVARIKATMQHDPIAAEQMYRANEGEIHDLSAKVQLEHELKSAVLPVQAKNVAQAIITGTTGAEPKKEPELVPTKGAPAGEFPRESNADRLERAQASLRILQQEQAERPNDEALGREVARTQKLIGDLGALTPQPAGTLPVTAHDTRAQLATWISTAEREAERLHPNDPIFRDLVLTQVKGYVNTIVSAQEGIARQAHAALMTSAMGSKGGPKPLTLDDLLNTPTARDAWALTDAQSQRGILALLEHNAKEARGEFARSNPAVVQELFRRVHLPEGDSNQIRSASQLAPFFAQGLNRADYDWLRKEIDENQKPEGNLFLRDVRTAETTARRMLMGKANMLMQPDIGEEASHRFTIDLRQRIEKARAEGKDPRALLTPGTPEYVLTPEHVASFMPNSRAAIADAAKSQYKKGEVYHFKQGDMEYLGGPIENSASWKKR